MTRQSNQKNTFAEIGKKVRKLRTDRGWSQSKLCQEIRKKTTSKLYQPDIATIEAGKTAITLRRIEALAKGLGISKAELIA